MKEFPRAKSEGSPEGKWFYLKVYPEWSPYTHIISFQQSLGQDLPHFSLLTIIWYTAWGVYCVI